MKTMRLVVLEVLATYKNNWQENISRFRIPPRRSRISLERSSSLSRCSRDDFDDSSCISLREGQSTIHRIRQDLSTYIACL